jgi:hypothetical protein
MFNGYQPGKAARAWIQALAGGAPVPVTPEGVSAGQLTTDGTKFLARDLDGQRKLFPVDATGGAPVPIRFLEPADSFVRIGDGRTAFIRRPAPGGAAQILRIDLTTGTRTPVRTIVPPAEALSSGGFTLLLSADGASYVYNFTATNSDLFLVKGLR